MPSTKETVNITTWNDLVVLKLSLSSLASSSSSFNPLMRHCAEVAADSKKAPGANVSGVVAGPLREQAGMDALVLLSPVKQKAMKQVNCTSSHWRRLGPRFGGGDEVGALAPTIVLPSPPNVKFGGEDGGGLAVFANFNI